MSADLNDKKNDKSHCEELYIKKLLNEHAHITNRIETSLNQMERSATESNRVANLARNSREILDNLDREFELQTGLSGIDIAFLFTATALQCARIFLINNFTTIENAGRENRNENLLHDMQNKVLIKFENDINVNSKTYYASLKQIVSTTGVPYDATCYFEEKFNLFRGANHRFSTLGHDPILGLIFGTTNILTNTITCIHTPIITTNHVIYDINMKNPKIGPYTSIITTLSKAAERLNGDIPSVVAAVIKQIIHIGTDLYTTCGIQIPGANLILENKYAEQFTQYINTGDIVKTSASMGIDVLINTIISTLHMLMYDSSKYSSKDMYNIKTRKIILFSNLIASTSNVIWVSGNVCAGNASAIRNLDIGGFLIILNRLKSDTNFIRNIKEEFIFGEFNKMIQGDL